MFSRIGRIRNATEVVSFSRPLHKCEIVPPTLECVRSLTSLNCETPYNLCFLRHGQSTWNRDNRFIGWTDTPLTEDGVLEARVAGQILERSKMMFDEVHTSVLRRCIRTVNLVLMEIGQEYIPVYKNYRLNERNYGNLVGSNKKDMVRKHGVDQVKRWRRSFDEPPPEMDNTHPYWPGLDPRYGDVSSACLVLFLLKFVIMSVNQFRSCLSPM
mmetsp:Transcript_48395/g.48733  ORF Transcript_48395/g.48733 Transcript_48395/m.48733 type:complete len:213 (-) Transcript_48395:611-1249(-)